MGKLATMTDVSSCLSIPEVLDRSRTAYKVRPMVVSDDNIDADDYRALVRTDNGKAMGFVSNRYRVNDHADQLMTLDKLVLAGDIIPQSVSMWDNGAVLAYQFRCPTADVSIGGKDVISPLLTLAFSYGGMLADMAFFADFRWFCSNQLGKVADAADERLRHRGDIDVRFGDLLMRRVSELGGELASRYQCMARMMKTPLPRPELGQYVGNVLQASTQDMHTYRDMPKDSVTGIPAMMHDVIDCIEVQDTDAEGSVWQAYNAVTRYTTHKACRTRETALRQSLLGGKGALLNQRAFREAARLAA